MTKGIDVSSYQGRIDWELVKPNIDFAIIRCGWGNDDVRQDDVYYERNAQACKELGIPFGVYLYSYATNLDEARSEVMHTLRLIKGKKLEYPVYLDVESKRQMALPKCKLIEIVKYYCEEIESAGYYVGIYSSLDRFNSNLDSCELDAYDKWVAEWNDRFTYKGKAGMWQNTSREDLPGIDARVDGDISFYDFPKIIKDAGLNHLNEDNYKYKVCENVYVSGNVYESSEGSTVLEKVCDAKAVIEEIVNGASAPYRISKGYVEEDSVFIKCE